MTGLRRPAARAALVAALAALFLLILAAAAHAGTVRVHQCNAVAGGGLSPRAWQADAWYVANGEPAVHCGAGGGWIGIDTANHRLAQNESTDARFALPGAMPHAALRTMWVDWSAPQQAASTNPGRIVFRGGGARLVEAGAGAGTAPGSAQRLDLPGGTREVHFGIWCSPANGPGFCNWYDDLLDIRGVTVDVEESGEPAAGAAGPLTDAGTHRGVEPLEITATDEDSGVRRVSVLLGPAGVGELAADCHDDRLPPCPQTLHGTLDVNTGRAPDGVQRLRLVVTDAAGNSRTVDAGTVTIASQPPPVTSPPPTPAPSPGGGPGGSGGGSGPVEPAVFPPNPLAGRGHVPNGTHADARARVRAWLELTHRHGVARRRWVTVPPGLRVRIRGGVRDRRGRPIGGATLAAYSREPGDVRRPITGVRTRPNGRFTAFTRIGPSRTVRFVYYPYGDSTRGIRSAALHVTVRRPR